MLKVLKFGGSSLADAQQFAKVKAIVEADESRRVVIVSAPGKRFSGDHKITDLLYLCAAHIKYGVSCEEIFDMIRTRYLEIAHDCGLKLDLNLDFDALWAKMQEGIEKDELASRGEYFSARLMAEYLGYEFLDAAEWVKFRFDGTVDTDATYEALRRAAGDRSVVIPGFYGVMPDGRIRTFSRGGSDITGALAAAALDADVYENWTDVSGILMADPRIVDDPAPIRHLTYGELRELSYIGAQVLHEGTIFPCVRRTSRSTSATRTSRSTPAPPFSRASRRTRTTAASSPASRARRASPSSPSPRPVCPATPARSCGFWKFSPSTRSTWSISPPASTSSRWWWRAKRSPNASTPCWASCKKRCSRIR
ncbi:MAG: hypothetical protein ACLR1M_12575 [Oscillospiraceae bacterium]